MCGIAGIIGPFSKEDGQHVLEGMLKTIEHRGPDSNGLWSKADFAFGMQRLSIIDLKGGDQPIWSDEGVGIVFNGEIYNFKKIREELIEQGVTFTTNTDTEVILQLYCKKGLLAIQELEGMFAIALYDPKISKLYLIRDRLGVKPLYYYSDCDQFIFASEIKAILSALLKNPQLDKQAISDYLTLRYVPAPNTIWERIFKLEPAHYLEYNLKDNTFEIQRYWDVKFISSKKKNKVDNEFENLFLRAVEKRLLAADVPVGILLSGGLDSSCVAAAAVELGHQNFHTFSIGFEDGGEFSELEYARKVSEHVGSQHHEILISKEEFIDFIPKLVYHTDEPLADLASIPLYYLSKLARKHVKVVLSGEGADEVFAGYNLDRMACTLSKLKILSSLPKAILRLIPCKSVQLIEKYGYKDFLKSQLTHITSVFSEHDKLELCNFPLREPTFEKIRGWYGLSQSPDPIDQLQQVYCHSWLVEDLLMKADKMSMATSLELRVPFLDHTLVEWAAKLPLTWKVGNRLSGFSSKRILRRFAEKRLPKEIIERPKQGFPVPAYHWIKTSLKEWAREQLSDLRLQDYFKKIEIEKLLNLSEKGSLQANHQIWSLIIFNEWLKRWIV